MDIDDFKQFIIRALSPHFDWIDFKIAPGYGIFVFVTRKDVAGTSFFIYFETLLSLTIEKLTKSIPSIIKDLNYKIDNYKTPIN